MYLSAIGGEKVNLNEECLLQYLSIQNNSQNFVTQCEMSNVIWDSSEYNEVAWLFI